eukprot:TRINITY_DN51206_c0_g1_i1.p1 TRINITY_DN51206_c0_g1~~TRINITY_DN51206_c0_g1_i1.p1  ORF type:complete len:140 (-),score=28.10 TRINITY_DN51206_c0_g1_i1:24-443(-)
MDGVNVDSFCEAAFKLFGGACGCRVYNILGEYSLSGLLPCLSEEGEQQVQRSRFEEWRHSAEEWCVQDPEHPLAALLPHIDETVPPLVSGDVQLSHACQAVLGETLTKAVSCCTGYQAFARQLKLAHASHYWDGCVSRV